MSIRAGIASRIMARDPHHREERRRSYSPSSLPRSGSLRSLEERLNASTVHRKDDAPGLLPGGFLRTASTASPNGAKQKNDPLLKIKSPLKRRKEGERTALLRQLLSNSPEPSPDPRAEPRMALMRQLLTDSTSVTDKGSPDPSAGNARPHKNTQASTLAKKSSRVLLPFQSTSRNSVTLQGLAADLNTGFWQPDTSVTKKAPVRATLAPLAPLAPPVEETCDRARSFYAKAVDEKPESASPPKSPVYDSERSDTLKLMRRSRSLNPGPATPSVRYSTPTLLALLPLP
jgi:hypothetical protein